MQQTPYTNIENHQVIGDYPAHPLNVALAGRTAIDTRAEIEADKLDSVDDCHGWVDVFDMLESLKVLEPEQYAELVRFWANECKPALAEAFE